MTPPRRHRLAFWLLLGLFSTAIPEIVSGSSPFVLLSPWGLLVTLPLYLLHAVFLAGVVYRYSGALRLGSLYLAGALFGLYEAYLTKVLWAPTWEPIPVRVGGVHVFETALLVLLWHPLLAFVVPLGLAETLGTRSRLAVGGCPPRVRAALGDRRVVFGGVLVLGAFQGAVAPDSGTAPLSAAGTAVVLVIAVVAWRRRVGEGRYAVCELLPAGRELVVVGVLLAAMYVALGLGLRPERLPGVRAQATVWLLYLAFGTLLFLRLRRDRRTRRTAVAVRRVPIPTPTPIPTVATFAAVYVLAVGASSLLLSPFATAAFVGLYVATLVVGTSMLTWIVGGLRRPPVAEA